MTLVGEVEVVRVHELDGADVIRPLLPQATPERLRSHDWLFPEHCDEDANLRAAIHVFVLRSHAGTIVVDTGVGDGKPRVEFPQWSQLRTGFLDRLRAAGVEPDEVTTVVCTHLHVDHVGWNTTRDGDRWQPTFPNATYVFVRDEYEHLSERIDAASPDLRAAFADSVRPIADAGLATLVERDHAVDEQVRLVPTPGHTPAHVSVAIASRGERALVSGDVFHHPCQLAFPEWSTRADTDPVLAAVTRTRVLEDLAASGTLLIGSHFVGPVVGGVARRGDAFMLRDR